MSVGKHNLHTVRYGLLLDMHKRAALNVVVEFTMLVSELALMRVNDEITTKDAKRQAEVLRAAWTLVSDGVETQLALLDEGIEGKVDRP